MLASAWIVQTIPGGTGIQVCREATVQIKDLTVEEFRVLIRETVEEVLAELLTDPDQGKTLKGEITAELLAMRDRRQSGKTAISSGQAMAELGLS